MKDGTSARSVDWRRRDFVIHDNNGDLTVKLWGDLADTIITAGQTIRMKNVETALFSNMITVNSSVETVRYNKFMLTGRT